MARPRSDFEEAWLRGQSLPEIRPIFKPMMRRSDWERLPRWRRTLDRLLLRHPPKGYGELRGLYDED